MESTFKKSMGKLQAKLRIKGLLTITVVFATISNIGCSREPKLSNHHLNYAIFHSPPFDTLVKYPNGTFDYYGSSLEVLKWLSAKLNFTYGLVPINETLSQKMGTHEAVFYMLINDPDIHGISSSFVITADRKERFDWTFLSWTENFCLVVPRPGEESRLFAFIRPFQPNVWLLTLISIIVVVSAMTIFTWFYRRHYLDASSTKNINSSHTYNDKKLLDSFTANMIYVLNILTNQGCREGQSRHSFRLIAGVWVLLGMVLVNSFSGILISSLTIPKMKPSIKSFEDLAASEDVEVLIRQDTGIGDAILKATSGVYKTIGDKARAKSDRILSDPYTLNTKLSTGKYGFPFINSYCASFIGNQYIKEKKCRFEMAKLMTLSTGYFHFPLKKGDPNNQALSQALMVLFETGMTRFWVKRLISKADECFDTKQRKSAKQVPIRLQDLTSAFFILGIGIALAFLAFLLEQIQFKFKRPAVAKK